MSILVVAEHDNKDNKSATLVTIAAAQAIGGDIDVLVAGSGVDGVASQVASVPGVNKVLVADNAAYEHQLAENLGDLVAEIAAPYSHVLAPHTANGRSFLPRVAAKLGVAQISDIISVESPDTFKRPIYAGNAIATVKSNDAVKVVSVREYGLRRRCGDGRQRKRRSHRKRNRCRRFKLCLQEIAESERPELTAASVIISGGRGMQNGENFSMLDGIADKLGAAIGASRAAVDAGFVPNDMQVGQTGKICAGSVHRGRHLERSSTWPV